MAWVRVRLQTIARREPKADAESAMIEIYTKFTPFVRNYVHRVCRVDVEATEEIVQDTLHEVWRYPDRFRGDAKFTTWLLSIARHKAIDRFRAFRPEHEPLNDVLVDEAPAIPDQVLDEQIVRAFKECMDSLLSCGKLSSTQYDILYLTYVRDLSSAEAAEVMKCSVNTVLTRLFHARKRIAHCLSGRLGGDPRCE